MAASPGSRRQCTSSCGLFLGWILQNFEYFWRSGINQALRLYLALLGGQVPQMCKHGSAFPRGKAETAAYDSAIMIATNVGCGKGGGTVVDRKKQAVILWSCMLAGYSNGSGSPVSGGVSVLALHEDFIPVLHC